MGFRFRKSINAGPLRLNFSKSGLGWSVGGKGARFTHKASGGTSTTLNIPGTGISYVSTNQTKKGMKNNMTDKNVVPQNWIVERLGLTDTEAKLACAAINTFGNRNFTQREMADAGCVVSSQIYTNLYNKNVLNKNEDHTYCVNVPYINRIGAEYHIPRKGHSLLLHLLFGGFVLWIPAIYYTCSKKHYWHL